MRPPRWERRPFPTALWVRHPRSQLPPPQKDRASDGLRFPWCLPLLLSVYLGRLVSASWRKDRDERAERGTDARSHTAQRPRLQPSAGQGRALPAAACAPGSLVTFLAPPLRREKTTAPDRWEVRVKIPGDGVHKASEPGRAQHQHRLPPAPLPPQPPSSLSARQLRSVGAGSVPHSPLHRGPGRC